jgi:hypothetical protein
MNAACRLYNLELEVYNVGTNGVLAEPYFETPFSLLQGPRVLPDFICKPYKVLRCAVLEFSVCSGQTALGEGSLHAVD